MFLKFDHTAKPLESLKEISISYQEEVKLQKVEGTTVKKPRKTLKLRLEFKDGSAWGFELPDGTDGERFLERFLREVYRRTVTDVPAVVKKLLEKEVQR